MFKKSDLFYILILFFISCSSSPRYSSSNIYYGVSSFYGLNDGFDGELTANGEIYDKDGLSAAHKTLPLNSIIEVTNLANGKTVKLKVNDRGPYIDGRILDCSYGAAKKLDFVDEGITDVRIEIIKWGDNAYKKQK